MGNELCTCKQAQQQPAPYLASACAGALSNLRLILEERLCRAWQPQQQD